MQNKGGNRYILAMYDIRGKQEYIYKSTKIREIVGASYIIRDCFDDYLYPAAKQVSKNGLFNYQTEKKEDVAFSEEKFKKHLKKDYLGEVVYNGGGNFFVLYKDIDAYRKVNQFFYRNLLEGTYSLRVLTSYIEGVNFNNYKEDQRKLYEIHRKREQKESSLSPVNTLPIVQVDYRSFLPLAEIHDITKDIKQKVSYESKQKYKKYDEIMEGKSKDREIEGERMLDEIVTQRGEESLIAIIYIDGNSMGAKVESCLKDKDNSYESSVNALRKFSSSIQKNYIDDRIKDVNNLLDTKPKQNRRFVVYAGDEITFICNARYAYEVAKEYLEKLYRAEPQDKKTSCAGISIFHSHVPFSEAYRIAEECCESGKQLMKKENIANASLIDFHYCQGAIGTSLEDIREQEENTDLSRPWFIKYEDDIKDENNGLICKKYVTGEIVDEMKGQLQKAGRGNIKNLMFSAKKSEADFFTELERIRAHQMEKEIDFTLGGKLDKKMQRKLIYDMVTVYDLWFREE